MTVTYIHAGISRNTGKYEEENKEIKKKVSKSWKISKNQ